MITHKYLLQVMVLFSLLCCTLVPQQASRAQTEDLQVRITQVDTSDFPRVTVYVSITNANGEPVGASPNSIRLYENGQIMQPDRISGSGELGTITTMLVMDLSGSMERGGKLEAAKEAARAYIDQLRPGDQVGLIGFNIETTVFQAITSDHEALVSAIDQLMADEDTAMYDALLEAIDTLESVPGRNAIILLSDGYDNRSTSDLEDVLSAIESGALSISTIGLGDPTNEWTLYGLDEETLQKLAENAGGLYGTASDSDSLAALYESYGLALQSEYSITYTSPSTLRDGINRMLTVTLVQEGNETTSSAKYNPGGVLPEVNVKSWALFGGTLTGLVLLGVIPALAARIQTARQKKRKPRIRLK